MSKIKKKYTLNWLKLSKIISISVADGATVTVIGLPVGGNYPGTIPAVNRSKERRRRSGGGNRLARIWRSRRPQRWPARGYRRCKSTVASPGKGDQTGTSRRKFRRKAWRQAVRQTVSVARKATSRPLVAAT